MKVIIRDEHLGGLAENKSAGKPKFPTEVVKSFKKKLTILKAAPNSNVLRAMGSLHFEKLEETRYEGKYSIRLNLSYRMICQLDKEDNLEVLIIEEINNHYK